MKKWFSLLLLSLLAPLALAAAPVDVHQGYVRAVPPGQANSAAFMRLQNRSAKEVSLIRATSGIADAVELHMHTLNQGVMQMRQVSEIRVPGNGGVQLKPGGYHIMLIGLKKNLFEGRSVKIKLYFSNGSMSIVELPVKKVMVGGH